MRNAILCMALIVPLSSLALAEDSDGMTPAQPRTVDVKKNITKMTLSDESFVKKAAAGGQAEVALSKMALSKSKDPEIRSFAEKMVKDHSMADKELQGIAQAKGIAISAELDDAHKKEAEKLTTMNGAEFDNAFREQMQKDHDKTVELFAAAAEDKSLSPELSGFAQKTLPVLRSHQHDAHKMGKENVSAN